MIDSADGTQMQSAAVPSRVIFLFKHERLISGMNGLVYVHVWDG